MGKILKFMGVEGDVYNPTAPFQIDGREYLAARVEKRNIFWEDANYSPKTVFFSRKGGAWTPARDVPVFHMMEDPFKTFIAGEFVFGGVEVFKNEGSFRTVFLKGNCPKTLKRFSVGPSMMKDIRLVELLDGRIAIFTRPQGGKYGKGKIGFITVNSLKEITVENLLKAKIVKNNLKENEWEGVNNAKLLESGKIAVLAHRATVDKKGNKHYVATSFVFHPKKKTVKNFKVIATRDDFPPALPKATFLKDVIFPGEISYDYFLYTGVGDTFSGVKKIKNPYREFFYRRP